jgi:hypothetical protein
MSAQSMVDMVQTDIWCDAMSTAAVLGGGVYVDSKSTICIKSKVAVCGLCACVCVCVCVCVYKFPWYRYVDEPDMTMCAACVRVCRHVFLYLLM